MLEGVREPGASIQRRATIAGQSEDEEWEPVSTTFTLLEGDCIELMRGMDAASVDAVVTDPPYGIGFMGREWDTFSPDVVAARAEQNRRKTTERSSVRYPDRVGQASQGGGVAVKYDESLRGNRAFQEWTAAWAAEALRVLKPGGHLVSFAGTRTYHRMTSGIEDAGFEIRDQLAWLFGQGFPKNRDLGNGWGTALKPAHEPIVLARKPTIGSTTRNVAEHGTGGLNIAACSIDITDPDAYQRNCSGDRGHAGTRDREATGATDIRTGGGTASDARWPANVILDETAAQLLDEQTGVLTSGANPTRRGTDKFRGIYGDFTGQQECEPRRGADQGGASRFFYCAKTSRLERNAGLDGFPERDLNWSSGEQAPGTFQSEGTRRAVANHHPTVKPIELMRYLVRLITPAGGLVLDPFTGSGTTGIAAVLERCRFVGCEREPDYLAIARSRIAFWHEHGDRALAVARAQTAARAAGQTSLLDGSAA